MSRRKIPDNADGLWRRYYGSALCHRYNPDAGCFANYQRQVAMCGRVTRTGSGSYSVLRPTPYTMVCRKCERLLAAFAEAVGVAL